MYPYLPDLLAAQLASFRDFLEVDLVHEIHTHLYRLPTSAGPLAVDAAGYRVSMPACSPQRALESLRTYGTCVYVPIQIPSSTRHMPRRYYPLMYLPLLTDTSHFIVNGVRRVVVHQMVRCPNMYYKVKLLANNQRSYIVSFVSERGVWLRLERDRKDELWARIGNFPLIPLSVLLGSLGVSEAIQEYTFPTATLYLDSPIPREIAYAALGFLKGVRQPIKQREFLMELDKVLHATRPSKVYESGRATGRRFLYDTFFNERRYSLSESGRLRLNRKVGLISASTSLQPEDVLAGVHALFALERGQLMSDDIDHLQNRRVRLLQHLLATEIQRGFRRLAHEKGLHVMHPGGEAETPAEQACPASSDTWGEPSEKPCEYTGQSRTLPMVRHGYEDAERPFKQLQTGGVACWGAGEHTYTRQRGPVPVPPAVELRIASKWLTRSLREFFGLNSLSQFMDQINPLAALTQKRRLTCLGPGGVSRQVGVDIRDIHPSHYGRICPIETPEGKNAGLVNSLASYATVSPQGYIESHYVGTFAGHPAHVRLQPEHEVQRVFYPLQTRPGVSNQTSSSIVQDTTGERWQVEDARFLLASPIGMISIATGLIPFLEHDDGNRALMASNMQRQAVPLLMPESPIVGTGLERAVARDSRSLLCATRPSRVRYVDSTTVVVDQSHPLCHPSRQHKGDVFHLEGFTRSNHDTLVFQTPCVRRGQLVARGGCLADTSPSVRGELALGKNMHVAYMPWEGYNFEDAVVLNQRMVTEAHFTSVHIEKVETQTMALDDGAESFYVPPSSLSGLHPSAYDRHGILRPGVYARPGAILVGKERPNVSLPLPEERLLYDIFEMNRPATVDCSFRMKPDTGGRVFETFFTPKTRRQTSQGRVRVHLLMIRPIQIGDKIAGRHGNKGIVSTILPPGDMPCLRDGTPMDIVLNPLGVPSRMNVGQIFECLLGLAGTSLGEEYRVRAFDELYGPTASHYFVTRTLRRAVKDDWWLNASPFGFGKVPLLDGRTGTLFEYPVTVGVAYILKLIHLVDKKIHARATGAYALMTQQPLKGRSAGGGQRVGEMEVWALQGFSASYVLQEMLTTKSDDCVTRRPVANALLYKGSFPAAQPPEALRLLLSELRALCFDVKYETSRPLGVPVTARMRARARPHFFEAIDIDPLP